MPAIGDLYGEGQIENNKGYIYQRVLDMEIDFEYDPQDKIIHWGGKDSGEETWSKIDDITGN